ncbi:MAG: threonine/serine dehydratase [Streptosporangiaceae bacterium]|nr:threonine/serine dehydratase [Streptosporangiaceae bacterium]
MDATAARAGLVTLAEIAAAARLVAPVVVRTPLIPFPGVTPQLLIKPESLQPTGSFKLRGAYTAITGAGEAARQRGVIAHSSGNHGHAVAYAAALLGVRAVVVVPETAPKVKTDAISGYGAELVTVAPTLPARVAATEELMARNGYVPIPPFDDRAVIAGQGTIGLEIAADCPQADLVLVPVSGGGLISGIAAALRTSGSRAAVVGVEPELAADARDSLRRGEPVAWPAADVQRTVADALRVERVGALPLAHIRELVTDIVTVTEEEMLTAVRLLATRARLVAEPGGAAAVAARLFRNNELPAAGTSVAVLSGGNVDPQLLASILRSPHAGAAGSAPVRARLSADDPGGDLGARIEP